MNDAPIAEDIPSDIWATVDAMISERVAHPGLWTIRESLMRAIVNERTRCLNIIGTIAGCPVDGVKTALGHAEAAIRKGSS